MIVNILINISISSEHTVQCRYIKGMYVQSLISLCWFTGANSCPVLCMFTICFSFVSLFSIMLLLLSVHYFPTFYICTNHHSNILYYINIVISS